MSVLSYFDLHQNCSVMSLIMIIINYTKITHFYYRTYKPISQRPLDREQQKLKQNKDEYQVGFRPNRSCPEQLTFTKNWFVRLLIVMEKIGNLKQWDEY